jgi:hypothetical protein
MTTTTLSQAPFTDQASATARTTLVDTIPIFILLIQNDMAQLTQLQNWLEVNNGQVSHLLPYQALVAQVPPSLAQNVAHWPGVAAVYTQAIPLTELGESPVELGHFATAWNNLISAPITPTELEHAAADQPPSHNDALIAPDLPQPGLLREATASLKPGYYQTSEFMAGSVAVGIVLLESDGSLDPSTEDWTTDEKQLVFSEVVAGLNWWAQRERKAKLSFVYDDHFSTPLPTKMEPINRPSSNQQYWIADAMAALGYQASSYFTRVRDYNNAIRTKYRTNWAFTIFVVDSSADEDNYFTDGRFAYAYLGGPFLVMTSGNNGYGPDNMDAVTAHEVGHIFYALDQYAEANQACNRRSGYLDIENLNSTYGGCPSNVNSIMRGQIYPYQAKALDPYAAGQVGWRDSDQDNILDPLEAELPVTINSFEITNNRISATGQAELIPYQSPKFNNITINMISQVKYRVDRAAWQLATAADGAFDSTTERYHLTSATLSPGFHTLEMAAIDSAGNVSENLATKTFIIADSAHGTPKIQLFQPDLDPANQMMTLNGLAYHTRPDGVIAKVTYRVNSGPWRSVEADDGLFNSSYEPFTLIIKLTDAQAYFIEVATQDIEGITETPVVSQAIQLTQPFTLFLPVVVGGM